MKVSPLRSRSDDPLAAFEFAYDNNWYADENKYAYHLMYGLLNGYPLCCVLYFCSIQDNLTIGMMSHNVADRGKRDFQRNRILCPDCYWDFLAIGMIKDLE